jgi:hypothetical protein
MRLLHLVLVSLFAMAINAGLLLKRVDDGILPGHRVEDALLNDNPFEEPAFLERENPFEDPGFLEGRHT